MLVITRNQEQAIHIGDDITIKVLGLAKNQVKIGITAPKNIGILREELLQKL